MAHIREWTTTAGANTSAPPDGFPEGMAPSALNDGIRELMAQLKTWYLQSFPNHITGLKITNGTDSDHDIDIAKGAAMDSTGVEILEQTTAGLTKQIDATFVAGDGAGGLDTGAVAADTLYAVWLAGNPTSNVVDALFSTSFTVSGITKPTGYSLFQLIGAVATDSSSNIIGFTQHDNYFEYTGDLYQEHSFTPDTTATYQTKALVKVPPSCIARVTLVFKNTTGTSGTMGIWAKLTGSAADTSIDESVIYIDSSVAMDNIAGIADILLDASQQMDVAALWVDGAPVMEIATRGFHMLSRGNAS